MLCSSLRECLCTSCKLLPHPGYCGCRPLTAFALVAPMSRRSWVSPRSASLFIETRTDRALVRAVTLFMSLMPAASCSVAACYDPSPLCLSATVHPEGHLRGADDALQALRWS